MSGNDYKLVKDSGIVSTFYNSPTGQYFCFSSKKELVVQVFELPLPLWKMPGGISGNEF